MPTIETQVQDWSTEAADAFLNRRVNLNDSIRKIASRENLNREKVARIVEESNKEVWLRMFEKSADKCFTFPVADTKVVLGEEEKPAVIKMGDMGRILGSASAIEKTATDKLTHRALMGSGPQRCWEVYEKSIVAMEIIREKAALEADKLTAAQVQFCKTAQQMVLQEDYSFDEVCEAMTSIRPKHVKKIAMLLKIAAMHIGHKFHVPADLEKRAGAMVDPGEWDVVTQISASGMPVEVINGSHKLTVALDTLIDQTTEAEKANKNLWSADDTVKFLRKEVRNYIATHRHV